MCSMYNMSSNTDRRSDLPENPDKKRRLENGDPFGINIIRGGSRKSTEKSKKRPTARRRRSSKRMSRKMNRRRR